MLSCLNRQQSPVVAWDNKRFQSQETLWKVDWESVKEKETHILSIFISNLPKEGSRENFYHAGEFFTKDRIASKIKLVQNKYRNALDLEKQNGAGRIVATFYNICNEILSR